MTSLPLTVNPLFCFSPFIARHPANTFISTSPFLSRNANNEPDSLRTRALECAVGFLVNCYRAAAFTPSDDCYCADNTDVEANVFNIFMTALLMQHAAKGFLEKISAKVFI